MAAFASNRHAENRATTLAKPTQTAYTSHSQGSTFTFSASFRTTNRAPKPLGAMQIDKSLRWNDAFEVGGVNNAFPNGYVKRLPNVLSFYERPSTESSSPLCNCQRRSRPGQPTVNSASTCVLRSTAREFAGSPIDQNPSDVFTTRVGNSNRMPRAPYVSASSLHDAGDGYSHGRRAREFRAGVYNRRACTVRLWSWLARLTEETSDTAKALLRTTSSLNEEARIPLRLGSKSDSSSVCHVHRASRFAAGATSIRASAKPGGAAWQEPSRGTAISLSAFFSRPSWSCIENGDSRRH